MTNVDSVLISRDITDKGPSSQSYGFSSSHIWMWVFDHKECWRPKNWCFRTVVLEKTLESPLHCKEIKPIDPKGNQFCNIHWKDWCWSWSWSSNNLATWCEELTHWKRPDAGKDWRREEKGTREDEMVGMASLTWWTWVWVSFRSWWWTERPSVLYSMGLQKVGHDWVTELELELCWEWGILASEPSGKSMKPPLS